RRRNGWYWNTGMGEGMDDSPRNALAYYTMSAAAEQALAALALSRIARACARDDLAAFFAAEHAALGQLINDSLWDARHQIYNDRTRDGQFITELKPGVLCKHAFIFWPLMAEVADQRGVAGLVAEIANPDSFNRSSGIASLSADSRDYREDGQYWRGAVWPPTQCIVQEGLRVNGQEKLARELAGRYLEALVKAFEQDETVTENLAPDSPRGHGAREFVGWGGIGPIANLIEYVLGFQVNAPEQSIEWRIERTDRHGIQNLSMGKDTMSLICARRERDSAPCHIEIQSSGDFTLKVLLGARSSVSRITAGRTEITVEPGPAA
ncbi:MAG TPA: trehalase family glycosidase, partial [Steroidobacteraceae bacterium]|nr:trehalase family glycosidase [Steroidobacteraceae bacterium]